MTDQKPEPEYRYLEVKCVRGFENRTIAKWENDGWEYLSQETATIQSTLKFRREKGKLDKQTKALIAMGGIVAIILVFVGFTTGFKDSPKEPSSDPVVTATASPTPEETPEATPTPEETPVEEPAITAEQASAREVAVNYLDYSSFSRKGLINQLKFEGFSKADSTFAVDSLNINWNNEAARKAQEYLNFKSFSRAGLISQLVFEGFSKSQATYGAKKVGK